MHIYISYNFMMPKFTLYFALYALGVYLHLLQLGHFNIFAFYFNILFDFVVHIVYIYITFFLFPFFFGIVCVRHMLT